MSAIEQVLKMFFHKTSCSLLKTRFHLQTIHVAAKRSTALVSAKHHCKKNHCKTSHKSVWLSG